MLKLWVWQYLKSEFNRLRLFRRTCMVCRGLHMSLKRADEPTVTESPNEYGIYRRQEWKMKARQ